MNSTIKFGRPAVRCLADDLLNRIAPYEESGKLRRPEITYAQA